MTGSSGHPVTTGVYWTPGSSPGVTNLYFACANSVGVLPVTWRKACENAGTLA